MWQIPFGVLLFGRFSVLVFFIGFYLWCPPLYQGSYIVMHDLYCGRCFFHLWERFHYGCQSYCQLAIIKWNNYLSLSKKKIKKKKNLQFWDYSPDFGNNNKDNQRILATISYERLKFYNIVFVCICRWRKQIIRGCAAQRR